MTARTPRPRRAFEDVIRARTGADFVERAWLYDEIEQAMRSDEGQYVLVTGEPGAGKTSLLAGIARARPDRLRYFFRRDGRTAVTGGDTESFLLSIGHQLARERPELFELERLTVAVQQHIDSVAAEGRVIGIKIDDLKVSPFHRTATLEVEQRIGDVAGTVNGVEIGTAHMEPRLLDPDNLAHLALLGPAQVLAEQDPEARIVILLDALDEIADDHTTEPRKGLLHWLTRSPELPANVKVVMTARPHAGIRLFRSARQERLTDVVIDAGSPQVVSDLHNYAHLVLERPAVLAAERARDNLPGSTKRHAVRRAAGNFLYLATYARALIDAAERQDDELVERLLAFNGVPGQLPGLYGFFVELVREELTSGRRPTPGAGADEPAGSWEGVGLPIIGVLTVAREALTEEQLAAMAGTRLRDRPARKVLTSLRWLLERRSDRFAFFHTSISEFLAGAEAREKHPECWVDETRWHERIARRYRGTAPNWADVDWSQVDPYGLSHLAVHVLNSGPSVSAEAADLVCAGLRRAIRTTFQAERRFLELVDSIAHHIADTAPVATGLPTMTYLGVVRHQAAQSSGALPPRVIGLLARVGRVKEALEHANGIGPSLWRVMSFVEILRYASPGPDTPSVDELLDMIVESAVSVPGTADRLGHIHARRAIKVAARLLAPHDVERALRLWQYGQETMPYANGSMDEPDEVYRAAAVAAAERDVDRARALIDMIRGERWADYLDLAERADPEKAVELLWEAEAALESAGPTVRLLGLARLAAVWASYDPATSRAVLAEVRAQVFVAGRDDGLSGQLVKAADLLADVDRTTARFLLARLDTDVPGASLAGAALWTRWGSPERARALLERRQAKTRSDRARLDVMKALGQSDRAEELRLVERIHAAIPGPSVDQRANTDRSRGRDDDLVGVVQRMAEYDLARAAEMARGVQRTDWSDHWNDDWSRGGDARTETEDAAREVYGSDRYSLLAGIAHVHVARGQAASAATILEELLRSVADPAPLRGGGGKGRSFASAVPESSEPPARNHMEEVNLLGFTGLFNADQHWAVYARNHFFRTPADVVRAVDLGGHGSLAGVVRRFAARLAHRDLSGAAALMRSIADPAERAIGFAELHRVAHGPDRSDSHHGPDADVFSKEIDRALSELPRYRWTVGVAAVRAKVGDEYALAYVRPDHRVRFELAVRALGCRQQDMRGLEGLPYLRHAFGRSMVMWASAVYANDMIAGNRPHPDFAELHLRNLSPAQDLNLKEIDAPTKSGLATSAYQEHRIAREVPGYRATASRVRFDDPVYDAAMDLVTPAPGAPLSAAFSQRIRKLLVDGPVPAAADLLVFAAEARPEHERELRELAEELVETADDGSTLGVDALSTLATSPLLGDLVDPVEILRETARCVSRWPGEEWIPGYMVFRLFPVLLERAPRDALHKFYEATSKDWSSAMALLEHAPDAVIAALGADAAATLGSAIAHGLACTSPTGTAPDVVDGVRLARLGATRPADRRQAR
ncbi:ATP-binding protein [Streptomyces sp. 142MFCol3.1]|uniref:ATP-binding protein n=1 Tax=Streptomyces sp. 142MFCol3.1 TaxID=1172179 RepID=UPI0004288130|nr:ATP-binding protein [Streptomyces sp. 142MFCol3.1]